MQSKIRREPAYIRLTPEQASAKISLLCKFCDRYKTDPNPIEARRLGLGESAYQYRNLDETALAAYEAQLDQQYLETGTYSELPARKPSPEKPMGEKACRSCGEVKPLGDYYPRSQSNDGTHSSCKACMTAKALERRSKVAA